MSDENGNSVICASCGSACRAQSRFCTKCGQILPLKIQEVTEHRSADPPLPKMPLNELADLPYSSNFPILELLPSIPPLPKTYGRPVPEKGFQRKYNWSGKLVTVQENVDNHYFLICCPCPDLDDEKLKNAGAVLGLGITDARLRLKRDAFAVFNNYPDQTVLVSQAKQLMKLGIHTIIMDKCATYEAPIIDTAKYADYVDGTIVFHDLNGQHAMTIENGDYILMVKGFFEKQDIERTKVYIDGRSYSPRMAPPMAIAGIFGPSLGAMLYPKTSCEFPGHINIEKLKVFDIFNLSQFKCMRLIEHIFSFKKTFGTALYNWDGFNLLAENIRQISGFASYDDFYQHSELPHFGHTIGDASVESRNLNSFLRCNVETIHKTKVEWNRFTHYSIFRFTIENLALSCPGWDWKKLE